MQPKPPENPNTGPIPTDRNRQIKARLSKDHTELDLWDFDGDSTPPVSPSKDSSARGGAIPAPAPEPDPSKRNVTRPKEGLRDPSDKLQHLPIPPRKKSQGPASASEQKRIPASTEDVIQQFYDDKEAWDDLDTPSPRKEKFNRPSVLDDPSREAAAKVIAAPIAEPEPAPAEPEPATSAPATSVPATSVPATSAPATRPGTPTAEPAQPSDLGPEIPEPKPAPPDAPLIPRIHLQLSHIERIGLIVVAVLIAAAGIYGLVRFFHDIPTQKERDLAPAFPVTGELISIQSARTFWRKPIRSGTGHDNAKMETSLIPVLELTLSGSGNGAIRVIFRDDQGASIGDSTTRRVTNGTWADSGQTMIAFPSTDGFDDTGMYNAYRTGGTKAWRAEILEGPSPEAPRREFKKLCDVTISTERR
jgi:hypothetical protein